MSLAYRLTVATDADAGSIAARAFPDPAERPHGSGDRPELLRRDLYDTHGFAVVVRADRDGYVSAEDSDDVMWRRTIRTGGCGTCCPR